MNMNILQISIQAPGYNSGGELGILQFSFALTRKNKVTYIGPQIENKEIESWFEKTIYLSKQISTIETMRLLMKFEFDKYYVSWDKLNINFHDFDVIYIDFTRWDYALKSIKKSGYKGKTIVRAHNVEKDYLRIEYNSQKTIQTYVRSVFAERKERYMVNTADIILAITPEDKKRLIDLYSVEDKKILVCPVGVNSAKHRQKKTVENGKKLNCLITGSLWFGPNAKGVLWTLKEVIPRISDFCELTIAGSNPNDEITNVCKEKGIALVASPETMKPYFEAADMVIVPIFDGSGMKVKIAEAMSYNLPIVTTSHGKIGYKIVDHETGFISDDSNGFAERIREYWTMSPEKKYQFLDREWNLYKENYSLEAICKMVESLLEN